MKNDNIPSENNQEIYAIDIGSSYIRLISGVVTTDNQITKLGCKQCKNIDISKGV